MSSFYIYCPCSVNEMGLDYINEPVSSLSILAEIASGDAPCRWCGGQVRRLGQCQTLDKKAGLKGRKLKRMMSAARAETDEDADQKIEANNERNEL